MKMSCAIALVLSATTLGGERQWLAMGVLEGWPGLGPQVQALAMLPNGDIVAGGSFRLADGQPVNNIARWDGQQWHAMSDGVTVGSPAPVRAMTVDADGNLFVAGGPAVRMWGNNKWSDIPTVGMVGSVTVLSTSANNDIYAGGLLRDQGQQIVSGVARFAGDRWIPLGLHGIAPAWDQPRDLAFLPSGAILCGGASYTVVYDAGDQIWRPFGGGGLTSTFEVGADGALYAGRSSGVARWGGNAWDDLIGSRPWIDDLVLLSSGELIAAGNFSPSNGAIGNRVARWDGQQWSELGEGIQPDAPPGGTAAYARALLVDQLGNIIVGGAFTVAGDVPATAIAIWGSTQAETASTHLVVPIHGQVVGQDILIPGAPPPPPGEWIQILAAHMISFTSEINSRRVAASLPPVEVQVLPGIWNDLAAEGFSWIMYSRLVWLWSASQTTTVPYAREYAANLEQVGRSLTTRANDAAVYRLASQVHAAVQQARQEHGPDHPITIDLIGHSRGGLLASELAIRLMLSPPFSYSSDPNIALSVTAIDAIDASATYDDKPGDLPRPLAYAGYLLDQSRLVFEPSPAHRVTNLRAEFGLLGGESGWYLSGMLDFIHSAFGLQPDRWFVLRGYPLGRERPVFAGSRDFMINGESHTSMPERLVADFGAEVVGVPASAQASIAASTFLGELLADPLSSSGRVRGPADASSGVPRLKPWSGHTGHQNYLELGTVELACEQIQAAQDLASDAEFCAAVPADYATLLDRLDETAATGFPSASVWEVIAGAPSLACGEGPRGAASAWVLSDSAIQQQLRPRAIEAETFRILLEVGFETSSSALTVELMGSNLSVAETFLADTANAPGEPLILTLDASRQDGGGCEDCDDAITLWGLGVRVYDVAVYSLDVPQCLGDTDGDGVVSFLDLNRVLADYGSQGVSVGGDITVDGRVDFDDLNMVLGQFGMTCR